MDSYAVSLMKKYHKDPFVPFRDKVKILSPFTRERDTLLNQYYQPVAVHNERFFKVYLYTLKVERLVLWSLVIVFSVLIVMGIGIYISKFI